MTNQVCMRRISESVPLVAQRSPLTVSESSGSWLVLSSSGPLATQLDLRDRWGIWSYVPLHEVKKQYNGGPPKKQTEPLFKGYVFARASDEIIYESRRARLVWGAVPVSEQDKLTAELVIVETKLAENPSIEIARDMKPGRKVEILDGPYRGQVGSIVRRDSRDLFAIELPTLGVSLLENIVPCRLQLIE